jgi:predicted nucleic acid-binding protein
LTLVIDASAAGQLLFTSRLDAALEGNSELIAPDLIVAELLNARWKIARAGGLAPTVSSIVDFLGRIRILPSLPYAPLAAELSERLNHPIYDCLYVAIARQESVKLLTHDAHLMRKLRSHKLGAVLA